LIRGTRITVIGFCALVGLLFFGDLYYGRNTHQICCEKNKCELIIAVSPNAPAIIEDKDQNTQIDESNEGELPGASG